jgi:hypothetical protein
MNWLLTMVAAWFLSLGAPATPDDAPLSEAAAKAALLPPGAATIRIDGRDLNVDVNVYRNLMPIANNDDLQLRIAVSTHDARGLPNLSIVKAQVTNYRRQTWKPIPVEFALALVDHSTRLFGAGRGPKWPLNYPVTVRLDLKSGPRTYTLTIPTTIQAVR